MAHPGQAIENPASGERSWPGSPRGVATQPARMTIPRGFIVGTLAAVALVWALFPIDPGRSLVSSGAQTAVLVGLLVLTARSRRVKVLLVRTVQRWTINPLMRLLLAMGINPLGLAILETRDV